MKNQITALLAGALFAVGLVVGGMTDPMKVVGFLDVAGHWDPSLAFVMGGAILVYAPIYRLVHGRKAPAFDTMFHLPTRRDIDRRLVIGSAMFGVGWGLGGYCPGPGLVSMVTLSTDALAFVGAMVVGMAAHHQWTKAMNQRAK